LRVRGRATITPVRWTIAPGRAPPSCPAREAGAAVARRRSPAATRGRPEAEPVADGEERAPLGAVVAAVVDGEAAAADHPEGAENLILQALRAPDPGWSDRAPADAPDPGPSRREPARHRPRDAAPTEGRPAARPRTIPPTAAISHGPPRVATRLRKNFGIPYWKGRKDLGRFLARSRDRCVIENRNLKHPVR